MLKYLQKEGHKAENKKYRLEKISNNQYCFLRWGLLWKNYRRNQTIGKTNRKNHRATAKSNWCKLLLRNTRTRTNII